MSMYSYCMFMYLHRVSWHSSGTLTEVFPCFFLSCKANARARITRKDGYCLCMCTVLLPPGGYPIAVKCTISISLGLAE